MDASKTLPLSPTTAVIVATRGRPKIVKTLVGRLSEQSRPPEHIFIIGTAPEDVSELDVAAAGMTIHIGRPGSALQRNDGLALAGSRFSHIVFFDDDFVPSRFWIEEMAALFQARPDVAGLTGFVLADGASGAGIELADALVMVERRDCERAAKTALQDDVGFGGNIGCNMAFRYSSIRNLRFDERLPGYAWLEDADFRGQALRQGRFVRTEALWGVHLGHKLGRARGIPLGYSQIANAVYLAKKGTVPAPYLAQLALKNVLGNIIRSIRPEPFIDRRGRLRGNMLALADLLRGRIAPEHILMLNERLSDPSGPPELRRKLLPPLHPAMDRKVE
ncbi:MAG: glycosyltransferase family 2 protein [Variibacter sp.]